MLTDMKADISNLAERISDIDKSNAEIKLRMSEIEKSNAELKLSNAELKSDVNDLRSQLNGITKNQNMDAENVDAGNTSNLNIGHHSSFASSNTVTEPTANVNSNGTAFSRVQNLTTIDETQDHVSALTQGDIAARPAFPATPEQHFSIMNKLSEMLFWLLQQVPI